MKFLVFGTGAIGAYLGGSLALAGHEVTFIDRPGPAERIREHGVKISEGGRTRQFQPHITTSVSDALETGPYAGLIFSVKAYHTESAARSLEPVKDRLPPIFCFQNGIDNEAVLARALSAPVIPCTVTTAIGKPDLGRITVERKRGIGLADHHPTVSSVVGAMAAAGLNAVLYPSGQDLKWSKLLTNLLANASSAILDMSPAEIFSRPELYRLEIRMLRETLSVMEKGGIGVTNLPGTPVKALAFAAKFLPLALSRPLVAKAVGGGRGGKMPSFHIELATGTGASEVSFLNGKVAEYGDKYGVPTPVNSTLTRILTGLTEGEIPREHYAQKPEALLRRI